jgi:hypothetical protein
MRLKPTLRRPSLDLSAKVAARYSASELAVVDLPSVTSSPAFRLRTILTSLLVSGVMLTLTVSPSSWADGALAPQAVLNVTAVASVAQDVLVREPLIVDQKLVAAIRTAEGGAPSRAGSRSTKAIEAALDDPTPTSLLELLRAASPAALATLMTSHPGLVQDFWNAPPDAGKVASWWASSTRAEQDALAAGIPTVVGNLGGVPYAVRSRVNLAQLVQDWDNRAGLPLTSRAALERTWSALDMAKNASGDYVPAPYPHRQLIDYTLAGDNDAGNPLVAVAYGAMDTAQTVTWMAPGMLENACQGMDGWGQAAQNLYHEQSLIDHADAHAVVAWMGYNTPGAVGEQFSTDADAGSPRFAAELDADHDTRAAADGRLPSISVVAHSYGTTMAADALMQTKYSVESFTMVASAGIDTSRVPRLSDLHVDDLDDSGSLNGPAIYTTAAAPDKVAPIGAALSGRAEPNPAVAIQGARTIGGTISFSSDGDDSRGLLGVQGHNVIGIGSDPWWDAMHIFPSAGHGYFDQNTQSLKNVALSSMGDPSRIDGGARRIAEAARAAGGGADASSGFSVSRR